MKLEINDSTKLKALVRSPRKVTICALQECYDSTDRDMLKETCVDVSDMHTGVILRGGKEQSTNTLKNTLLL